MSASRTEKLPVVPVTKVKLPVVPVRETKVPVVEATVAPVKVAAEAVPVTVNPDVFTVTKVEPLPEIVSPETV